MDLKEKRLFCSRLLVVKSIYIYGNKACYFFEIIKTTAPYSKNPLCSPHTNAVGPLDPSVDSRAQKVRT